MHSTRQIAKVARSVDGLVQFYGNTYGRHDKHCIDT